MAVRKDRPDGAGDLFGFGCYKDSAPTELTNDPHCHCGAHGNRQRPGWRLIPVTEYQIQNNSNDHRDEGQQRLGEINVMRHHFKIQRLRPRCISNPVSRKI